MKTEVTWVRDMLRGDDAYEMRVKLIKQVPEEYPYKDEDQLSLGEVPAAGRLFTCLDVNFAVDIALVLLYVTRVNC